MSEKHANLMTLTPLQCLEEIRKLIHDEDFICVTATKDDTSMVQLFWAHHDGHILELASDELPTLTAAIVDFNLKLIEQERESERRRIADAEQPTGTYSILPGLIRTDK